MRGAVTKQQARLSTAHLCVCAHTHTCWDTALTQGARLPTGLTNSNRTGSGSQNPKAQKAVAGKKNTPKARRVAPPNYSSVAHRHGLLISRKVPQSLCSGRALVRTPARTPGFSGPPTPFPSLPSNHSPPVGCRRMSAGLWGFRPRADRGVLARPGGERTV